MGSPEGEGSTSAAELPASPTYVVGIGASAGGLEALERLFRAMPLDSGFAFVVIQHLSPDYKSLMDELMARFTKLAIVRVGDPTEVRANTIYLLPPSKEMIIDRHRLVLVDRIANQPVHLPISRFFRSLAHAWGDRAIAIVLSGTGSDGSAGVREIHDAGGLVLAQTELTARFDGMPRSAVATGFVDQVLSPEDMPACLLRYAANPEEVPRVDDQTRVVVPDHGLGTFGLLERIRDAFGIDFTLYKQATVTRRIHRRMEFGHFTSLDDYCARAATDPEELGEMCRDLLIGVTRFFRDPDAFQLLRDKIVPDVVAASDGDVRVWVPGCATGEEAYSLAMLFTLELERVGRSDGLRVFASDVHRDSLRVAGEGVYTEESLEHVPAELRDRFFVAEHDGRFRVTAQLRKRVLFSPHNVLKDVAFNRIDLVSCRNLLIYFLPEAQTRSIASFHFALKPHGVLFLGPSESPGELEGYFETLDRTWRVYRKTQDTRLVVDAKLRPSTTVVVPALRLPAATGSRLVRAYDALLNRYMPSGILVNDRREQQHVFGDGNRYLRPPVGRATLDVVAMCDGDLRIAVSAALASAARRGERVELPGVRASDGTVVSVVAEPVDDSVAGSRYFLLRFVGADAPVTPTEIAAPFVVRDDVAARIRQLEAELVDARESYHSMLEEFEATNEELQASNEELIAGNEELQSTNEELQSVNEELHSVNAEYNQKIRDVAASSADLRNLIATSHAGVVFTDERQVIRLYTPGAAKILNLMPQDVGRPLAHITSQLDDDSFFADLRQVQGTLRPVETTLSLPDQRFLLRRIQTYEDADGLPAGFAITFTDITERKRNELAEEHRHTLIKMIIDASGSQIAVVDRRGVIIATNHAWDEHATGPSTERGRATVGTSYFDAPQLGLEGGAAGLELLREVLDGRVQRGDLDYGCTLANGPRWYWLNVTALPPGEGGAVITHTDITARKQAEAIEQKLLETAKLESLGVLAGGIAHDFNNLLTGVVANASLIQLDLDPQSPLVEPLGDIHRAAVQATDLCAQMLAFSGRGRFVTQQLQVGALVRETTPLIRTSLGKNVALDLRLEAATPMVEADRSQIQQVVMNLVINGAEALPDAGGTVRVETTLVMPGARAEELQIVAAAQPHHAHVALEVTDDGCGIPADTLERIFEPFHTSKFTGRGLGLSAVLGIVRGHGGALYVRSSPGAGSTFRVLLPASGASVVAAPPASPAAPLAPATKTGVLIIDDEEMVRNVLARILVRSGYRCETASSGAEGVAKLSTSGAEIAVALLDLTMPGDDGVVTFQKLHAMSPDLRVLLMSGYSEVDATSRFGEVRPAAFLQKPIDARTLEAAVRAALGR